MSQSAPNTKLIRTCSIWRALEIVGDTPTLLLMQSYWLGTRRFDEFGRQTGLLKPVVSDRLKRLIKNKCLVKVEYSERPKRYEYRATEQFLDFFPFALSMLHWERQWGQKPEKLEIVLTHSSCGQVSEPFPACKSCKAQINPQDVSWEFGPGVGKMEAKYSARRRQASKTKLLDEVIRTIGDRWSTLILRSLFSGLSQFQEILEDTGIATNILSNRLSELIEEGILYTVEVPSDSRRIEYKLTEKGLSIYPIIISLLEWGDKWLPAPDGPPLLLTHKTCGKPLKIEMICSVCEQEVPPDDTSYVLKVSSSRAQKLSRQGNDSTSDVA